jgi:hypothetical protein
VIASRGLIADRHTRQSVGQELNQVQGQRWLGRQLASRMEAGDRWVVDGLRFAEDFAFWKERFGSNFVHVTIEASTKLRMGRYPGHLTNSEFEHIDLAPVERDIGTLAGSADHVIVNEGSLEDLAECARIHATLSVRSTNGLQQR